MVLPPEPGDSKDDVRECVIEDEKGFSLKRYLLNGKLHGLFKTRGHLDVLQFVCTYARGKKHGRCEDRSWRRFPSVTFYILGHRHGLHEEWYRHPDGWHESRWSPAPLRRRCWYERGLLHGPFEEWHEQKHPAKKKTQANYERGRRHGLLERWHANGQPAQRVSYVRGKKHGPCVEWYPNGRSSRKLTYDNGKKDGLCFIWSPRVGGSVTILCYENNVRHGPCSKQWSPAGRSDAKVQSDSATNGQTMRYDYFYRGRKISREECKDRRKLAGVAIAVAANFTEKNIGLIVALYANALA